MKGILVLGFSFFALVACSLENPISGERTSSPIPTDFSQNTPSSTQPLGFSFLDNDSCVPVENKQVSARVVRVVDGDTIVVEIEGNQFKLRYIGMNTPETGAPGGSEATEFNRQLVAGKTVTLIKDVSEVDRYGRLLRYVFVGDLFVNYEIVRSGYANYGTWPPDTSCDQVMVEAYNIALANRAGLFSSLATGEPVGIGEDGNPTSTCPTGCPIPPSGCMIKGNISSKGIKLYHIPGQKYYPQTVISPEKGEFWFCTEIEAINNGWQKSNQ